MLLNIYSLVAQKGWQGRVAGDDGRPVHGASILDRAGNTITITDSAGIFNLATPFPRHIVVSHVSYTERIIEVNPNQAATLDIILKAVDNLIQEVKISTGFQLIPKERATGAFSHIDNEKFNEQVSMDVISRLEAVANGLNFERVNSSSSEMGIRIRGLSTLSTGSIRNPLIILDHFPYEGDLNNINPNDVESVTLLKDAAASSIWGARAGNGVIVITTKRSERNQRLSVDINSNVTIGGVPNLGYYTQMDASEYIDMERFLFERNHRFSDTSARSRPPFSKAYEVLFKQKKGEIDEHETETLLDELAKIDIRDDYLQYIYEPSINQQYALGLKGGNSSTSWRLSSGYDRSKSALSAISNRYNISFINSFRPIQPLEIDVGLRYTENHSVAGRSGYPTNSVPYTQIVDEFGAPMPVMRDYRLPYLDTLGGGRLLDWHYYPLTNDDNIDNQSKMTYTLMNAGIIYKLKRWLSVDLKYQYGKQQGHGNFLHREESYFVRNLINQFSQLSAVSDGVEYHVPRGGVLDMSRDELHSHNVRGQISIDRTSRMHDVTGLIGVEASHRNSVGSSNRTYGYDAEILTFRPVDYLGQYPHFITGSNSFIPQSQSFSGRTARFISTFANAAYTYGNKYTVTVSARRDASNQFGVNFNDRWNLLWSSGLSWEISNEPFYRVEILPYVRLRATYGFSGNTDLSRSAVTTISFSGTSPYFNAPMSFVAQNANPELGWERVRMVNLALDFRSSNGRFDGNIDYFFKHASDLFGPDPVDPTTGIQTSITRNIATLKGRGLDMEVNSLNVDGAIKWKSNFGFSFYTDEVISYNHASLNASDYVANTGLMTRIVGERLYSLYSYRWNGLDSNTGDPVGFLSGQPSKDYNAINGSGSQMSDVVNHGSAIPLINGSLGNSINFNNWGISFRFIYKLGYYFRDEGVQYNLLFAGRGNGQHPEYSSRWQKPGDEVATNVPAMVYPTSAGRDNFYRLSEIKVERADNIRLQYINLFYNLPERVNGRIQVKNMRVYLNMANLGMVWKSSDSKRDPSYGIGSLPPSPTFSFGVRLSL